MSEIILVNVSGTDKPGLTASLTAILARYQINILDIGQDPPQFAEQGGIADQSGDSTLAVFNCVTTSQRVAQPLAKHAFAHGSATVLENT